MAFFWDSYERKAVVAPAILVLLPYGVLQYCFLEKIIGFYHFFDVLKILTRIGLPSVFLYFITSTARMIGKGFFERIYFKQALYMPTTNLLLYSNSELSRTYKKAIRTKIEADFSVRLLTEAKEAVDELEARRAIVDAVGYVRNQVKRGYMVLKHNIQYGFWRNLVGGSVIGLIISLINLFIFKYISPQVPALWISGIMAFAYFSLIASSKWAIGFLGKVYAKRLYQDFMTQEVKVLGTV